LAQAYKEHSQNAQRLISLNDTIRDREERAKEEETERRVLRLELERLGRKAEEAREVKKEHERAIQTLQDELATLTLEYTQLERRNDDLRKDNAELVKRWLERKNDEATKMNSSFDEESKRIKAKEKEREKEPTPTPP
jgi:chromosome segregation ATPase